MRTAMFVSQSALPQRPGAKEEAASPLMNQSTLWKRDETDGVYRDDHPEFADGVAER
jgi:hypothetical protein